MPTIRKRQTKKGIVYDVQVRINNENTGEIVVRATTWTPDKDMKPKQVEKELLVFADEYEQGIKKMMDSAAGLYHDPNVTFSDFAQERLEEIAATLDDPETGYSPGTYVKYIEAVAVANEYIGGRKVKDITPAIMQAVFDKLDGLTKTVLKVTPKPGFRELLNSNGFTYNKLRFDYKVQPNTLTNAVKGGSVSKEWAVNLCDKIDLPFALLFDEVATEEPYAFDSIKTWKKNIRAILSRAVKKGLLQINPASGTVIEYPKAPKRKTKCMDDELALQFRRCACFR